MNIEGDDMSCPKCKAGWRKVEGNKLICSCGYIEEVKPTYEQLLAENKELKIHLAKLEALSDAPE